MERSRRTSIFSIKKEKIPVQKKFQTIQAYIAKQQIQKKAVLQKKTSTLLDLAKEQAKKAKEILQKQILRYEHLSSCIDDDILDESDAEVFGEEEMWDSLDDESSEEDSTNHTEP